MKLGPLKLFAVAGGLTLLGSVLGLAPGCTVLVSDRPLDDASPGIYSSCNECLYQTCMAQWSVCAASRECMSIYTCSTAPGCDQACVDACYLAHPSAQGPYYSLASCDYQAAQSTTCKPLCSPSAPDSGAPDTATPDSDTDAADDAQPPADSATPDASPQDASTPLDGAAVQTCSECAAQKCAAERAACTVNTPCETYTACLGACTTIACVDACAASSPDGKTASQKYSDCISMSCSRECGVSQ